MPSSLGPAEILVILVVALIVLGPKRLPDAARQVGKTLAEVRKWSHSIQDEVRSAIEPDAQAPAYPPPPPPTPPPMTITEPSLLPLPASEPPVSLPMGADPSGDASSNATPGPSVNGTAPAPSSLDPSEPPSGEPPLA